MAKRRRLFTRIPDSPRLLWLLIACVVCALGVRIAFSLSLEPHPYWHDAREYHDLARGLVETGSYSRADGNPTAFWPPGYPFLLALVYAITGPHVLAVRLLQAVLGAASCLIVFAVARRLVSRGAALLACAATALYPLFVYSAGTLFPVTLLVLLWPSLLLFGFIAIERASGWAALAAGVLGGCLALVTPAATPALLATALWIGWMGARSSARRHGWRLAVLFVIPILLLLGSWGARNATVLGHPVFASTNGGLNLWLGNHPDATATTGNRLTPAMQEERAWIFIANRDEVARDRALFARGWEHIRSDPARFLQRSLEKAASFWRFDPQPMTTERPGIGNERLLSLLSYGVLLPFAGIWFLLALRRSPHAWLILLLVLAYTAVHAIFIAKVRLRLPLDVFVIIYGAGGIIALINRLRGRPTRANPAATAAPSWARSPQRARKAARNQPQLTRRTGTSSPHSSQPCSQAPI